MRLHRGYQIVEPDRALLAEYESAKEQRKLLSLDDISKWPTGLQERFSARLEQITSRLDVQFGNFFSLCMVSSWVDGSGIDANTEFEEPEFWDLKKRKRTWNGRYPDEFKVSDYDFNVFTAAHDAPMSFRALIEFSDRNGAFKAHIYPPKGENRIRLNHANK